MSYILDALKRAEAERGRGGVPTLHSQAVPAAAPTARATPLANWVAAIATGALLVGAALWWTLGRQPAQSRQTAETAQTVQAPGPASAPAGPSQPTGIASSTPFALPTPSTPSAPSNSSTSLSSPASPMPYPPSTPAAAVAAARPSGADPAPAPTPPARSAAQDTPRKGAETPRAAASRAGAPAPATITIAPSAPSAPSAAIAAATAPAVSMPSKPATAVAPVAPTAPAGQTTAAPPIGGSAAGPQDMIYTVAELPVDIRAQLPALAISGASYSTQAAYRMLIVNGQVLHENDALAPGLTLEAIRQRDVVLRFKGYRYSVGY